MLDPQYPKGKLLQQPVVHMRQRQEHCTFFQLVKTPVPAHRANKDRINSLIMGSPV